MTAKAKARHRYYSVEQANALLPTVRDLLGKLRRAVANFESLRAQLTGEDGELKRPAPETLVNSKHLKSVLLFHRSVSRFHDLGLELKDAARGLVDFPARLATDDIQLCWEEGEPEVAFYHDLESGFSGRKPVAPVAAAIALLASPDDDIGE